MIISPTRKSRNVIPRWRSYRAAAALGDLNAAVKQRGRGPVHTLGRAAFDRDLVVWQTRPTLRSAADLVQAAIVVGDQSEDVVQAAVYLASDKSEAVPTLSELASTVLVSPAIKPVTGESIRQLRQQTYAEPRNPMAWADLALAYTVVAQTEKARHAMEVALQLAPENRHILRAGACFFTHIGEPSRGNQILNRSAATPHDPWLSSAEIATATQADISSRQIKQARDRLLRDDFRSHDLAELASAIATVELGSGNASRSKKLFKLSLRDPTENAVAQAEFISQERDLHIRVSDEDRAQPKAFEAVAINAYRQSSYDRCVDALELWQNDQPFRARPAMIGSAIAVDTLDDYPRAERIAKMGLTGNPTNVVLNNNLAVALARQNRAQDAAPYLTRALAHLARGDVGNSIVVSATRGLVAFRQHRIEEGRAHYETAINMALSAKLPRLAARAYLYLELEEAYRDARYARSALESLTPLRGLGFDKEFTATVELTAGKLEILAAAAGSASQTVQGNENYCITLQVTYMPKLALIVPKVLETA